MIRVKENAGADSRTAKGEVTLYELEDATTQHQREVREALLYFAEKLNDAGWGHDFTKTSYMEEFHKEFTEALREGKDFKQSKWYKMHITKERHHLLAHAPDDVNLIDVLEYIADGVMAGMARSGSVYDITLPDDILQKALKNTVELLKDSVILVKAAPDEEEEVSDD